MSDDLERKPLPPGSDGLPVLGETLSFAKNPFGFVEERLRAHGRVFRSVVLGRKAVVIAGPEAAGTFIDTNEVKRDGAMPPHIQELFGGRSLPLLDDEEHRTRKGLVVQAFTRGAMADYLPAMQQVIETALARWAQGGEFAWIPQLKALAIEVICTNVIGLTAGEKMDRLCRDYDELTCGFATIPINLPGTPYRKALGARDRILDFFRECVRERRTKPTADGLSRILAPNAAGARMTDEQAVLELHHIVIAGYIVFAELGEMVQRLEQHPDVRARLKAEVDAHTPAGAVTLETLVAMPYLMRVVNEVKRLCPIIPAVFGRAKRTFEIDGHRVPAGWMVMWAVQPSHVSQSRYSEPERFDPDRFSPDRAEDMRHEHAFAPQGAGPVTGHRCPGLDYATCFMQVFAVTLLRGYAWTLRSSTAELDYSKTPPEPADGLRATVRRI